MVELCFDWFQLRSTHYVSNELGTVRVVNFAVNQPRTEHISAYWSVCTASTRLAEKIFSVFTFFLASAHIMVINNVGTTTTTTDEDPASEHSQPSMRICKVDKSESGSCGFHLTRTKWDPYPWIAGVDDGSPAQAAGLRVGDCVLEVNGDDVLGQRVGQIAAKVVAAHECIAMLLWNAGSDANCDTEVSAIRPPQC